MCMKYEILCICMQYNKDSFSPSLSKRITTVRVLDESQTGIKITGRLLSLVLASRFFTTSATWEAPKIPYKENKL